MRLCFLCDSRLPSFASRRASSRASSRNQITAGYVLPRSSHFSASTHGHASCLMVMHVMRALARARTTVKHVRQYTPLCRRFPTRPLRSGSAGWDLCEACGAAALRQKRPSIPVAQSERPLRSRPEPLAHPRSVRAHIISRAALAASKLCALSGTLAAARRPLGPTHAIRPTLPPSGPER